MVARFETNIKLSDYKIDVMNTPECNLYAAALILLSA